jgi:hypothetical protein
MRILLLYTAGGCICLAQSLSVGAIGGIRLTDDIRSGQINASTSGQISVAGGTTSESRHYVVGPAVEIGLPFRLALEFDALYRREGYRTDLRVSIPLSVNPFGPFGGTQFDRARANSWEFPLLLKYKIPLRVIKPYVEVGYANRIIRGSIDSDLFLFSPPPTPGGRDFRSYSDTDWRDSLGEVAGLGVQFAFGRLLVSPEARYTRWNNTAIRGFTFGTLSQYGLPAFESSRNQVDLQIGLRWNFH